MPTFKHAVLEVPENDTRGLKEHAQDILLHGKVVKYEEEKGEQVDPAYADMLSEGSNFKEDTSPSKNSTSAQKPAKKVLDKWKMLEDDRAKTRSPPRKMIDPSVPNQDLIEEMLVARQKRYDRE